MRNIAYELMGQIALVVHQPAGVKSGYKKRYRKIVDIRIRIDKTQSG
jgi:hypothetical protein